MKWISFAFALAAVTACHDPVELSSSEQALDDCLPDANFCGSIGQPLPPAQAWQGAPPPAIGHGVVIVDRDVQGNYVAQGVDLKGAKVRWVYVITGGDLGAFGDQMDLAGLAMWVRPPPPPPPPGGQDVLFLLETAYRLREAEPNAIESSQACLP